MNQHLVAGFDVGQVHQPVPGRRRCGRYRCCLVVAETGRQRDRNVHIAGEEGSPAAVRRHTADVIAHLVRAHVRSDRGDHTGEVDAQLRLSVVARITTHSHQHVGEVKAGRGHRDLDLTRPGSGPLERCQFHGLKVTRCADLQSHAVLSVIDDGGVALLRPKWSRVQMRRVPLLVAECGLILIRTQQQLLRDQRALGGIVDINLSRTQRGVFSTDHPKQAAQAGLLKIGALAGHNHLGAAGDDVESGRIAGRFWQITDDPDQIADMLATALRHLLRRAAGAWCGNDDHVPESAFGQVCPQPSGVGGVVGVLRPRHRRHVRVIELERIGELRGQDVGGVGGADQQPATGVEVRGEIRQLFPTPLDGHQALVEHTVTVGRATAHRQSVYRQQNRAVIVDEMDIGFDT